MNTNHHDVVVVGAGPIGSATARHLAEQGIDTAIIGPEEPTSFEGHEGTWAGYYDEGRLCHVLEVPLMTSMLTMRSVRRFGELRAKTGIKFTTSTHSVTVLPEDLGDGSASMWFDRDLLAANARDLGVRVHELDEEGLRTSYPHLSFEPGHVALVQPDAFILNPRALVRAELAAAEQAGALLIRDEVVSTERVDGGVCLAGRSGGTWTADQVVLATGAASNMTGLLPEPLAMTSFGATVVLAEVEDPQALEMPTMMFLKYRDGERLYGGIVMAPRPYPDGKWYLKLAGSSLLDFPLGDAAETAQWVRSGGNAADIEEAADVLRDLLPGHEFTNFQTRPCLVSATPSDRPYIDRVDEHTVVAVEAERGAMAADEIGRLTAMLSQGPWKDTIPHEVFKAEWAEPRLSAAAVAAPSEAEATSASTPIVPEGMETHYEQWHIAPAVVVGNLVICSGVLGTDRTGAVPEAPADQFAAAFDNLRHVLRAAGADLNDVVELQTFHIDLEGDLETFTEVRERYLSAPWPAWTAVGAAQIGGGLPGTRVEIKATAALPTRGPDTT